MTVGQPASYVVGTDVASNVTTDVVLTPESSEESDEDD